MGKYNILYVDDEESNLRIFKDTFRRKFNVFTAISAKEGIQVMEENNIDLVLSDQRMPEMSGVEFLKYSFEKYPEANRILITGYSDINAVENAINQAKVFQYVQKPWNENSLLKIIDDALRIHELELENQRQKEELIIAKQKAEESDKLKTEFIQNMSHEIRTPMNGILGFATLLDKFELTNNERSEYIKIIQNSSMQLLQVIDDILEISKLVTNQIQAREDEFCLNELIIELHLAYKIKANDKGLDFKIFNELNDDNCNIVTDRTRCYNILSNLLENAFKFTEQGSVNFGYKLKNNNIEFFVKDTGIGIHPENQSFIFDRFSQEDKEIQINSGLGLGLSIAKENSKLINGNITLESDKGKGATFYLTIPYLSASNNDIPKEISSNLNDAQSKYKILVVEDEEINFMFIEALLKQIVATDFDIIHAKNGLQAVDICKETKDIDIAFMDIKMPIMNGYEATKEIKSFWPQLPIIAQTAYSSADDRLRASNAGCDGFISKPIDMDEMTKALLSYIALDDINLT